MSRHSSEYANAVIRRLMGEDLWSRYADADVTELMINGPDDIYIEGRSGMQKQTFNPAPFQDTVALNSLARGILQYSGKTLSPFEPSQEARMPDGSRVHIVLEGAVRQGLSIVIRKFPSRLTLEELVTNAGSMSAEAAEFLRTQIQAHKNIIISGGTGTGKTTLLNALANEIVESERLITIEDVAEIQLSEDRHVVSMERQLPDRHGRGGISIRELFRAALRMRPDRILVGECRGGEALDMIQAMNSGHAGSISTVHADDPVRAMSRLETLCLMADVEIPIVAVRRQLIEAIDVIVQVERVTYHDQTGAEKRARRVSHIAVVDKTTRDDEGYASRIIDMFVRASAQEPRALEDVRSAASVETDTA